MAIAPTISPPAPRPWIARNAMSWSMVCERPERADPIRKSTMAIISQRLRPYWSPSLPYSSVVTVAARMYAVTTQARWLTPCRSPTIRGSAVETTSWSSIAMMMASSRPGSTIRISRRGPVGASLRVAAAAALSDMGMSSSFAVP